jgi:hypothetical protein
LPNHSFQKFMWHTSTPHPPPYDRELPDGIKRLGLPVGTRFKIADWTPPYEIGVIALFVPRADAPVGRTADYASGPMIPDAVSPLAVDLDLLRDGVVVDPDFDPMLPPASTFDPRLEGHSHIVWNFSGGLEYMSRALGTGTYVWRGRVTDQTGQGYEIAFGPLIVEP